MHIKAGKHVTSVSHDGTEYSVLKEGRLLSRDGKEPADVDAETAAALAAHGCTPAEPK
jgi:hypothetical protein